MTVVGTLDVRASPCRSTERLFLAHFRPVPTDERNTSTLRRERRRHPTQAKLWAMRRRLKNRPTRFIALLAHRATDEKNKKHRNDASAAVQAHLSILVL
ncbi:MAG: hypothetical protein KY429_09705 [Actinobacteria bacterium]|nr:hypothetical protein [Actinomycetota bacterium]